MSSIYKHPKFSSHPSLDNRPRSAASQHNSKEDDGASSTRATYTSVFPNNAFSSIMIINAGYALSVVLAAGHHLLLSHLHGRNIESYSQFWVKNASNGFASVFSICLAYTAKIALDQAKWRILSRNPLAIRNIDSLLALPAPLTLINGLLRWQRPLLTSILASIIIQALVIVSILAPNALTITPSEGIARDMQVPTLNLSNGPSLMDAAQSFYTNVSPSWKETMDTIMLNPPVVNWKTPAACGAACSFEFQYEGPALDCRDITKNEYTLNPNPRLTNWRAYDANSTLHPAPAMTLGNWDITKPYDLSIQYVNATVETSLVRFQPGAGVYCHFRNASYNASFKFENNVPSVSTSIVSYGGILGGRHDCLFNETQPCWTNGVNTRVMCDVFATALQGHIGKDTTYYTNPVTNERFGYGVGLENEVGSLALIQTMFNHTELDNVLQGFNVLVPDLGKTLVDTFSNLTLGIIPHRGDVTTVKALVVDGSNIWYYTVWILWAVYAPALLLVIPILIDGLLSIRMNGMGMENNFSTFLLTTRNGELDDACKAAVDFEELQKHQLHFQEKGYFRLESDSK